MFKSLRLLTILSAVLLLGAGCNNDAKNNVTVPVVPVNNPVQPTPVVEADKKTDVKEEVKKEKTTVSVDISGFAFSPAQITIKVGDTVTWTNKDDAPHKVASNPHPTHTDLPGLVSDILAKGDTYSYTFEKAGTFGYHCHLHPNMTGTIIVE